MVNGDVTDSLTSDSLPPCLCHYSIHSPPLMYHVAGHLETSCARVYSSTHSRQFAAHTCRRQYGCRYTPARGRLLGVSVSALPGGEDPEMPDEESVEVLQVINSGVYALPLFMPVAPTSTSRHPTFSRSSFPSQ